MKLKSILLKNFRLIEEQTINLETTGAATILVGPNNSGKTSVAEAIAAFLDPTGLPREFRTRLSQIPIGHVIEVITGDPSAREDIPSLARLLGHQVRSVESGADGRIRIQVERLR